MQKSDDDDVDDVYERVNVRNEVAVNLSFNQSSHRKNSNSNSTLSIVHIIIFATLIE
jgi:hypothetical protein